MVPPPGMNKGNRRGAAGRGPAVPQLDADSLASDPVMSGAIDPSTGLPVPGSEAASLLAQHSMLSPSVEPPHGAHHPTMMNMMGSDDSAAMHLEQAYMDAKMCISQASRQVLAMVLHSLLDDYTEQLLGPISARLEVAMTRASMTSPVNPSSNALMMSSAAANARTPHRVSPRPSNASTPSHRKGAGGAGGRGGHKSKEEEQEMCSVHHSMRALKHLQPNPTTGKLECVHGFHCLVDTPVNSPHKSSGSAMYHASGNNNNNTTTTNNTTNTPTHSVTPKRQPVMRYTEEVTTTTMMPSSGLQSGQMNASTLGPSPNVFYSSHALQHHHQQQQQQLQLQRQQQNEHLQQQHEHLQQFHSTFTVEAGGTAAFGHIGNVPFALPTPAPPASSHMTAAAVLGAEAASGMIAASHHTDPTSISPPMRDLSPEDDLMDNKLLNDFVNSLGDAE